MQARALVHTRRYAAARPLLEELLPQVDELHGPGSWVGLGTRQDLAACLRTGGDLEGARDLYLEAIDLADAELPPDHLEHVRLRHNAAVACFELSDAWRSLQLDQAALARLRALPEPLPAFERAIRLQLALTARSLGTHVPDFADEHRRVLTELEAELGGKHADVLRLKSNLAGALSDAGRPAAALPLAREVLDARRATLGPDHPDTLVSRLRLAQVRSGLGEHEAALAHQRAVVAACRRTRPPGDPFARRARAAAVRTLRVLGRTDAAVEAARGWIDGLRAELLSSMLASWRERRERVSALRPDLRALARFGAEVKVDARWHEALFELVETARAASAAGPLRIDGGGGGLGRLLDELAARRRELGERATATGPGAGQALVAALHAVDARERELARELAARGLLPFRTVDAAALREALGPRAAALGFTAFDAGLARPLGHRRGGAELDFAVTLLAPDGRVRTRVAGSLCALEDAVARWRAAVGVPVDGRDVPPPAERGAAEREAAREILALSFAGELDALAPDVDTLYVCVEGALALVPLDALAGADGRLLGERFGVRCLTSFDALLAPAAPARRPSRLVAVGGLDYGASGGAGARFAPLPDGAAEVRAVAARFERAGAGECLLLEGADATRDAVRDALRGATHALLATHGSFDDSLVERLDGTVAGALTDEQLVATLAPLSLSFLALSGAGAASADGGVAGGRWTGEEIAGEDLRGLELVVLSACDTHRSLRRGGVGVLSLQTALHAAGARRSVTSLWRVKSDYGRLLVERFFDAYLGGASASDALWSAKRYLREERGLPPRFWAAWTLSGDA